MTDHDHDQRDHDRDGHDDGAFARPPAPTATMPAAAVPAATVPAGSVGTTSGEPVQARVVDISPEAADTLRHRFEESDHGGSRIGWFVIGFLTALVAGVIGGVVFLVVSDADDDGEIQIDVPTVDVEVDN